jgi:hypothetical protein
MGNVALGGHSGIGEQGRGGAGDGADPQREFREPSSRATIVSHDNSRHEGLRGIAATCRSSSDD